MSQAQKKKNRKKKRSYQTTTTNVSMKSLIHLHKSLKTAGALQDTRLKQFNRIGNTEIEWEENFIKQLLRPNILCYSMIEMWCSYNNISFDEEQNEIKTGLPIVIKHRISLITTTWQDNIRRYVTQLLEGIKFQNSKAIAESIENWELYPKERVISDLLKILQATSTSVYIHKGFSFPTLDPEIINNGEKYMTHFIENSGYYWPVSIFKGSRYQLIQFYDFTLEKRKRLVLTQADWTIPLKNDLEGVLLLEELSQKKIVEPAYNEYEEVFGKLHQLTNARQRSLEIEGYNNLHLGLDSLQRIIPLSLVREKQLNLITFYGSKVQNLGEIWSYFYLNNILTVQIMTQNQNLVEQKIIRKAYENIETQIKYAHLILCENCKDVLATKEIINKHKESCQQLKTVSIQTIEQ